jgi:hypothetical protein
MTEKVIETIRNELKDAQRACDTCWANADSEGARAFAHTAKVLRRILGEGDE